MGMTISFGPHQMKKKPRPLVGTKTFIREQEREMRNIEWSDSFGGIVIGALLDSERERVRPPQHSSGSAGDLNGEHPSRFEDGPRGAASLEKNGEPDEGFDGASELAAALESAGARATFDRGRNSTHPCTFCGISARVGDSHELITIGRYLDGHALTRPVCARPACQQTALLRSTPR